MIFPIADVGRGDRYYPPKKPYSLEAMLDDLLEFAAFMLVDDGRLSLWMPTANDEDVVLGIPAHPCLGLVSVCVQKFNKCSYSPTLIACSTDEPKKRVKKAFDVSEAT